MSTFSYDALRVIGLSRVIACGALYKESRELIPRHAKVAESHKISYIVDH